jgi:hypothetical protein
MRQITDNIIVLIVPNEAHDFGFMKHNNSLFYWLNNSRTISGGKGGMQKMEVDVNLLKIIGTINKLGEFDFDCQKYIEFKDDNSFLSLLNSKGIFLEKLNEQKILIVEKI